MTDLYQIVGDRPATRSGRPGGTRTGGLRPLIWIVVVVSAVGNSVSSFGGVSTAVHLAFGLVTAASVVALITHYLRSNR